MVAKNVISTKIAMVYSTLRKVDYIYNKIVCFGNTEIIGLNTKALF